VLLLQFAAVLNESKKKCREWQAKAQQAEERLENVRPRLRDILCVLLLPYTTCESRFAAFQHAAKPWHTVSPAMASAPNVTFGMCRGMQQRTRAHLRHQLSAARMTRVLASQMMLFLSRQASGR
jgi:hypothetical protein